MAVFDKLGGIAKNIGDKASDIRDKASDKIETTKLNSKINAEKTAIAECMRQIGEYFYKKHQEGGPDDAGTAELLAEIDAHYKTIDGIQSEIARIQEETTGQKQTGAPAPEAFSGGITCPACGQSNPAGTKFCSQCGGKIETPAPESQGRVCPGCGATVPGEGKFCPECGHKFE